MGHACSCSQFLWKSHSIAELSPDQTPPPPSTVATCSPQWDSRWSGQCPGFWSSALHELPESQRRGTWPGSPGRGNRVNCRRQHRVRAACARVYTCVHAHSLGGHAGFSTHALQLCGRVSRHRKTRKTRKPAWATVIRKWRKWACFVQISRAGW